MRRSISTQSERLRSALLVVLIHVALGYALVTSLGYRVIPRPADALKLFNLTDQPPPPPPVVPKPRPASAKPRNAEGAAAPPALRNTPTEVVAPKPNILLPPPPPLPAAPIAGRGSAAAAGAAPTPGPGTGSGGVGDGLGSGQSGDGTGGGGGGEGGPARQIAGSISNEDYPRAAFNADQQGLTSFRFTVGVTGRLTDCAITRSSGHRALDEATCRLALERFRFRPATDRRGRPVPVTLEGDQSWELGKLRELPDDGKE